jgi:hypothetical protein
VETLRYNRSDTRSPAGADAVRALVQFELIYVAVVTTHRPPEAFTIAAQNDQPHPQLAVIVEKWGVGQKISQAKWKL